jgi:phosphoserine phosphatase
VKTIYLVRHGETRANRDGLFRGRSEMPLSARGRRQAQALALRLAGCGVERVYVSPLQRAAETAAIAFPGLPARVDPRLNNLDLGAWTGLAREQVRREQPRRWQRWLRSPETMLFPGGESLADVRLRCRRFLAALRRDPAQQLAAVSHRAVLKVLLAEALGLQGHYFWRFHLDTASLTTLFYDPPRGFILYRANDTAHLDETLFEPD